MAVFLEVGVDVIAILKDPDIIFGGDLGQHRKLDKSGSEIWGIPKTLGPCLRVLLLHVGA